jgi:hypothetical protein
VAIEALVSAGLSDQARPLIVDLRCVIDGARAPGGQVVALTSSRANRSSR